MPRKFWFWLPLVVFFNMALLSRVTFAQDDSPKTIKLGSFTPPPTKTHTPTTIPTSVPEATDSQPEPTEEPRAKGVYFFSQRDPRWRSYDPYTVGQLGPCGCGETSVAMVLAKYFDKTAHPDTGIYNPPHMWDFYEKSYPGRCGSAMEWHQTVFASHGLKASINAFDSSNPSGSINVIKNYLDNGYSVIIHYGRVVGPGHYVLAAVVVGSKITVYDPYYLPGAAMPVTIEQGALIKSFIAVRK